MIAFKNVVQDILKDEIRADKLGKFITVCKS